MERFRKANPLKASYENLKYSARSRGIPFTITFLYFQKFARKVDLVYGVNNCKGGYTVDRKDPFKGYVPGNLQWLTRSDNSSKGNTERRIWVYEWRDKSGRWISAPEATAGKEGMPF